MNLKSLAKAPFNLGYNLAALGCHALADTCRGLAKVAGHTAEFYSAKRDAQALDTLEAKAAEQTQQNRLEATAADQAYQEAEQDRLDIIEHPSIKTAFEDMQFELASWGGNHNLDDYLCYLSTMNKNHELQAIESLQDAEKGLNEATIQRQKAASKGLVTPLHLMLKNFDKVLRPHQKSLQTI